MTIISSVQERVNYGVTGGFQVANKAVPHLGTFKKLGQIVAELIKAANYRDGRNHLPKLMLNITGYSEVVDVCDTMKNIKYWMNPFETARIDEALFTSELKKALTNLPYKVKRGKTAEKIVKELLANAAKAHSKKELRGSLKKALRDDGYNHKQTKKIASQVQTKIKPRPILEAMIKTCSTTATFGSNLLALQRLKCVNLAQLAASIGSRVPVLHFVVALSIAPTLKAIGGIALSLSAANALKKVVGAQRQINHEQTSDLVQQGCIKRKQALWDLAVASVDLINTVSPLFVVLNPPTAIALALLSKGTGLLSIFLKPQH